MDNKVNNILLIGNGFDLAHGLLTNYKDFLYILKNSGGFSLAVDKYKKDKKVGKESIFSRYFDKVDSIDIDSLDELQKIIKENSWARYFAQCGAEIDGWIDFEKEIYPVIDLYETIFNQKNYTLTSGGGTDYRQAHINKNMFNSNLLRTSSLWKKYLTLSDNVTVNIPYATMGYGILKKSIIKSLRDEFDKFIRAFEIYLVEFVHKKEKVQLLKQIKEINADFVISFNYTLTETLYGISDENVHHIHGMIRENVNERNNNMVMGVNKHTEQNMNFIYFVKYFQRIQKKSGIKYKSFIARGEQNEFGEYIQEQYELHIYGHSLDETDEDILKFLIGTKLIQDRYYTKAKKVNIYYYDDADYEQKVINLIKLYGRPIVEDFLERGLFEFIPTSDEIYTTE